MLIKQKKGWELPEKSVTSEAHYVNRRRLLAGMGIGGLILAAPAVLRHTGAASNVSSGAEPAHFAKADEGTASLYPAPRNARYQID